MSGDDVVGEVSATCNGESTLVRWKIRGDLALGCICSPDFDAFDSKWKLSFSCAYDVVLQLEKRDSGSPRTIYYKWIIQKSQGTFQDGPCGMNIFVEKGESTFDVMELKRGFDDLTSLSTLTVIFRMSLVDDIKDIQRRCGAGQESQLKEGTTSKSDAEKRNIKYLLTLSQNLKHLYKESLNCDVRIRVRNREFRAHKTILMARIPAFADKFSCDITERNDIITMDDCDPDIFDQFLLFLYSGELESLSDKNVFGLYNIADKYDLSELKEECIEYMLRNGF